MLSREARVLPSLAIYRVATLLVLARPLPLLSRLAILYPGSFCSLLSLSLSRFWRKALGEAHHNRSTPSTLSRTWHTRRLSPDELSEGPISFVAAALSRSLSRGLCCGEPRS